MTASRLRYTKNEKAKLAELAQAERKLRELIADPSTPPAQVLKGRQELGKIQQSQNAIERIARERQRANREKRDNKSEAADIPRRSAKPRDPEEQRRLQQFFDSLDDPGCPMCARERYESGPDFGWISDGPENLSPLQFYRKHPLEAPWNFVGQLCQKHKGNN